MTMDEIILELGSTDVINADTLRGEITDDGRLRAVDSSAPLYYRLAVDGSGGLCVVAIEGDHAVLRPIGPTLPFTWAVGDRIIRQWDADKENPA